MGVFFDHQARNTVQLALGRHQEINELSARTMGHRVGGVKPCSLCHFNARSGAFRTLD
jgi:hypothetical protein